MATFKQMEAFHWTAKLGSISAAAERLGTTQSTLSKRIHELETALSAELFDRSKRAVRLTLKGHALLDVARESLMLQARISEVVSDRSQFSGTFRFGVTELVAVTSLPTLVTKIIGKYPKLILEPQIGATIDLYDKLLEHQIDLVIGPRPPESSKLVSRPVRRLDLAWMCRPSLYPGDAVLPLSQICNYPILALSERSRVEQSMMKWLESNGVVLNRIIRCNSIFALAELAAAGVGIAYLARQYFAPRSHPRRLKIIRTSPTLPKMEYCAVYRADEASPLSAAIAEMVDQGLSFKMK